MRLRLTLHDAEGEHAADIKVAAVCSDYVDGDLFYFVDCEMPEEIAGQRVAQFQECKVTWQESTWHVLVYRFARPSLWFTLGNAEDTIRELKRLDGLWELEDGIQGVGLA